MLQSSFILHIAASKFLKYLLTLAHSIFGLFREQKFTEGDAFIGYQKDTPAAVVFQATHQLEREGLIISPQASARTKPVTHIGTRGEDEEDLYTFKKSVSCL